jgi:hypothetical protein
MQNFVTADHIMCELLHINPPFTLSFAPQLMAASFAATDEQCSS